MTKFQTFAMAAAGFCLMAMLGAVAGTNGKSVTPSVDATIAANCQKCHGANGDAVSPVYPRLNGQHAEYIEAQLKSFRGHRRDDTRARGYMWVVARSLDDKTIAALAQYYAAQKPTPPQTGGALAAEGEKLYMSGDPAKAITACQQCHGKAGEGSGATPRIAGQHAYYFRMVMGGFQSGLRQSDTMHAIAKNMTDRQIYALASYLSNE